MPSRMRQRSRALGAFAVLALLTAACTSDDQNDAGEQEPGSTPNRSTIVVATSFLPDTLIPHQDPILPAYTEAINIPLFQVNDEGELFSNLLESWDVSDDAKTVTFNLRSDIEWSDGTLVTSRDVVMSLTQYLDPSISSRAGQVGDIVGQDAFVAGEADRISGLSAPDDHTVIINLEEPDPSFIPRMGTLGKQLPVLPEHILGDVPHDEILDHEYFETLPVGSGPYKVASLVPNQRIELEKNSNWSLGEAGFERIIIEEVDPSAQTARLEAGEAQLLWTVPPTDADRLASVDGIEVQSTPGSATTWGLMYYEPLLDPRVRQAMIYAVDREGICEEVFRGYCTVPETNLPQVPDWAVPTDDVIEYSYDPDRARELLEEANWDPDNELTLYKVDNPDEVVDIVQQNMAAVGINWQIIDVDVPTWLESIERHGGDELQAWGARRGNFNLDPSEVQQSYDCDTFHPGGSNFTHYCDPELDELWDAGRDAVDQDERAEIYQEAFRRINQNPMELVIYEDDKILAHDSRLEGVKINSAPAGEILWNVGEWTWES